MKIYEEPQIEVVKFAVEDIVTTSLDLGGWDDKNTGEWN